MDPKMIEEIMPFSKYFATVRVVTWKNIGSSSRFRIWEIDSAKLPGIRNIDTFTKELHIERFPWLTLNKCGGRQTTKYLNSFFQCCARLIFVEGENFFMQLLFILLWSGRNLILVLLILGYVLINLEYRRVVFNF